MWRLLVCSALAMIATAADAEDWVALGGNMEGELDLHSVTRSGLAPIGRMRLTVRDGDLIVVTAFDLAANCGFASLFLIDSEVWSTWEPRVVKMPDLPDVDRVIFLPTENIAFVNFYRYLCQM
ncbi:hypothetical protein GEU84_020625 [Fertoebacter nigrum]|uniref:Uncharacterized protein n=1 Tax=Fertoeibacter niger TaxID=2656921 RepID=A0A8X8H3R3_9RHOB|nr:hypothetical protein [Fertoeibacter niger]NUB46796.1 hypothetical protein [Fertoeibacter niger]